MNMCFSVVFILTALPFLSTAIPVTDSLALADMAVPIAKRGDPRNGDGNSNIVTDAFKLQSMIRRSIA
jgi:hypothetical protein